MAKGLFPCFIFFIAVALSITSIAFGQVPCLSGLVRDESGAPILDADLDFDNAATGQRVYTPNDNTDEFGFYRVCLLAGTYHVSFAPPTGTHLLGRQYFNFALTQSQVLNVTLGAGVVIRGAVRDSLGRPVAGIDLDVDSLGGGGRVFTPNDNTDSAGAYWLVVPPGHYRLRLSPPPGSRYREIEIDSFAVARDTVIDLTMSTGHVLSGRVRDAAGAGLDSIAVDVRDRATGAKVFVPNNETDSLGDYRVVLPTGTFDIRFVPPVGSRLVAIQVDSIAVAGDRTLDQALAPGRLVVATVRDTTGAPVTGADLDFSLEATGQRVFTPYDATGADGRATVALPPELYTVRVDPPAGSILDRLTLRNVRINSDTSLNLVLREVDRVAFAGRLVNRDGAGLPGIALPLRSSLTGPEIPLSGNVTDSLGRFDFDVPLGRFVVFVVPPRGSHYLGTYLENVTFAVDTTWADIAIDSGVVVSATVLDTDGRPQAGIDFDFVPASGSQPIFTPHDITDGSGRIDAAMPAGSYDIRIKPPVASGYHEKEYSGVNIAGDTSLIVFLAATEGPLPYEFRLGQNHPNPFNGSTIIAYTLLAEAEVTIAVYNALGQRVRVIERGHRAAGNHAVTWDGRDGRGMLVASGIYFYELRTPSSAESRRMIFVK